MRSLSACIAAVATSLSFVPALAQSTPAQNDDEKMVCRKFQETGSLVKKRKLCMTRAEWRKVQTSQNEGSRKMVEELSGGFNCMATGQC